jgi:hypothetical protein
VTIVMTNIAFQQHHLSGPAEAGEVFDEAIGRPGPAGGYGQSLYYGPIGHWGPFDERPEEADDVRVDIDVDEGRAAVTWLADDSYAVELPPQGPLTVAVHPGWVNVVDRHPGGWCHDLGQGGAPIEHPGRDR